MNNISISGRLTADPEKMGTAESNKRYVNFCVAVYRDKNNTDFIDCIAWENKADFVCEYFQKGKGIEVVGALHCRNYEDKNGQKRKAWEISVSNVSFPPKNSDNSGYPATPEIDRKLRAEIDAATDDDDDDLPF